MTSSVIENQSGPRLQDKDELRRQVSEAARGVVTVLDAFGLDTAAEDLREAREFFRGQDPAAHLGRVLELACVSDVVMTNDPFDAQEVSVWEGGAGVDRRFHAA